MAITSCTVFAALITSRSGALSRYGGRDRDEALSCLRTIVTLVHELQMSREQILTLEINLARITGVYFCFLMILLMAY